MKYAEGDAVYVVECFALMSHCWLLHC